MTYNRDAPPGGPRPMSKRRNELPRLLLAFGILAFVLAGLSIVDLFLPRPYDGVVLETDTPNDLTVREVVPGSGAARAGIRPGDRIVGIDRAIVRSTAQAATLLGRRSIGDEVAYLLDDGQSRREVSVELGRRQLGELTYVFAGLLGVSFFLVGSFVLVRAPGRRASRVFFVVCTLFMLFLICRLRPASYSWVDTFVLSTGTAALLFLPASFLHFFLIFPRPILPALRADGSRRGRWALLATIYLVPPLVLAAAVRHQQQSGEPLSLISGAPAANWWLLALYMLLGLAALAANSRTVVAPRERRGALLVFFGALFGLVPFLVLAVAFPERLHTEAFLYFGVLPLTLVPLTFAYAIVRFQLMDVKVLLQKSLLYTLTTAVITAVYALGIASFDGVFRGTRLAGSAYSPLFLALAIVLLFEPLRQRIQGPVDRFFHAERYRLQKALVDLGEAFAAHPDLGTVVRELVDELPRLMGLDFAALYLVRGDRLERAAGPVTLPIALPDPPALARALERQAGRIARLERLLARDDDTGGLWATDGDPDEVREARELVARLADDGVDGMATLASPRRRLGVVVLSGKTGQVSFEPEELELLSGLLHQVAIALETNLLLEERTRQAELERELEIAASIQRSLLPRAVELAPGWEVAVECRPARHVGGDFLVRLPGPSALDPADPDETATGALAYGDVSGKSVSGALVMMAAYEILSSLAMTARDPERLVHLANRRLHRLGERRGFVALGYFAPLVPAGPGGSPHDAGELLYLLAGQPAPLLVRADGTLEELPLPDHRLPLGAMGLGGHRSLRVTLEPGDLVLGYSDGLIEAQRADGEFFGTERLFDTISSLPADVRRRPRELVRAIRAAVERFGAGTDPYDDLTLVALKKTPHPSRRIEDP